MIEIKGGVYILNREYYFLNQQIIVYCGHLLTTVSSDSNCFPYDTGLQITGEFKLISVHLFIFHHKLLRWK